MRQIALLLALSVIAPGCATTGGKVSVGIGAAATVGTVVAGLNSFGCPRDQSFDCNTLNQPVLIFGTLALAAFFAAALFEARASVEASDAKAVAPTEPQTKPQTTPLPPAPPLTAAVTAQDPQATQLTQQAYLAARLQQCVAVRALGERVRTIDHVYYERVFAVDPTIASCR